MEKQEVNNYVIHQLGRGRSRNDVITDVCMQAGLGWKEAETLVNHISVTERKNIVGKQKPLLYLLGIFTLLGGIGLAAGVVVATLQGTVIILLRLPIPYLGNIVYFLIGLAMIIGSTYGLIDLMKNE